MAKATDIDDYDLYDLDFEEWWRLGREAYGITDPPKEKAEQGSTFSQ